MTETVQPGSGVVVVLGKDSVGSPGLQVLVGVGHTMSQWKRGEVVVVTVAMDVHT